MTSENPDSLVFEELSTLGLPCLSVSVDVVELLRHYDDDTDRLFALLRRLKETLR